ncbi:NADH-quinone oxidoreductase subunit J [Deinococcus sp. HMF7604]|uniref:NADH-quinone oxidoreductase subunit J family protein n=1 Tax=Deinococcus betulae TaxID=2873312 RepID=UPI001CCB4A69|nr:NADH-quinone oxidoreductase subunit J [Deinococcus betulae]MBZ9751173.1 NADH-quinone oxidoreductase subunit J [Deinococcus betulae]
MILAFILLGALTIIGGIITIAAKNAVHAALGLVGTLLCVAGLFATLNASFLAATQVIVYAGAVMVLFLFVIMLLNANQPVTSRDPVPFVRELAGIGGTVLAGAFVVLAFTYKDPRPLADSAAALEGGSALKMGETLLTRFLLPFEAVSILLLVAIVGAVALVQRPAAQPDGVPDELEAPVGTAQEQRSFGPRAAGQPALQTGREGEVSA